MTPTLEPAGYEPEFKPWVKWFIRALALLSLLLLIGGVMLCATSCQGRKPSPTPAQQAAQTVTQDRKTDATTAFRTHDSLPLDSVRQRGRAIMAARRQARQHAQRVGRVPAERR